MKADALFNAAALGEIEAVKVLLSGEPESIFARDSDGHTPLHVAATFVGSVAVVELLLANGVDVNAVNRHGDTALHKAAGNGHAEVVALLVEHGAKVNVADHDDRYGYTPLHQAAFTGAVGICELLLSHGADVEALTNLGETALHSAARSGNLELVEVLLRHRADVSARNPSGATALHNVAVGGSFCEGAHMAVAERLIASGADINALDDTGKTPAAVAMGCKQSEMAELLCRRGGRLRDPAAEATGERSRELLFALELKKDYSLARKLIDEGANVRIRGQFGYTPLHVVAGDRPKANITEAIIDDMAILLIEKGADLNAKAGRDAGLFADSPPVHFAAAGGNVNMLRLLIERGAELNVCTRAGLGPLAIALQCQELYAAEELLKRGATLTADEMARVNQSRAKACHGDTLLHRVVSCTHSSDLASSFAEMVISLGADVNARNDLGRTPLMSAMLASNAHFGPRTVSLLVEKGADVSLPDNVGATARSIAEHQRRWALPYLDRRSSPQGFLSKLFQRKR